VSPPAGRGTSSTADGDNTDVWLGWTYHTAGPWWGDYPFSIQPEDGIDKPQMQVLSRYL
jgi:endoglucanase